MYLHGMSSGAFPAALAGFFGSPAGLSASVITRLTTQWQAEARAFVERDLSDRDYVYVWAGVHFNVRLEEKRLCALVIVGVRADGTKELVAITYGYRESIESWADVLRDLKRRGMRAPVLAVGDGRSGSGGVLATCSPTRGPSGAGWDGAGGEPCRSVDAHHLRPTGALGTDEGHDVSTRDAHGRLVHHREEDLEIERHGQAGVGSGAGGQELEVPIGEG